VRQVAAYYGRECTQWREDRLGEPQPLGQGRPGRAAALKLRADGQVAYNVSACDVVCVCVSLMCLYPRLLECVETVPVSDNNY